MGLSENCRLNFESFIEVFERLAIVSPEMINQTYIVEGIGDIGMGLSEKFRPNFESFIEVFEGLAIVSPVRINQTNIVERNGNIGVFLTVFRLGYI